MAYPVSKMLGNCILILASSENDCYLYRYRRTRQAMTTLEYDIYRDAPGLPFVLRSVCTCLKTRVVFTLIHPTRLGRLHDSVETDDLLHLESRSPQIGRGTDSVQSSVCFSCLLSTALYTLAGPRPPVWPAALNALT